MKRIHVLDQVFGEAELEMIHEVDVMPDPADMSPEEEIDWRIRVVESEAPEYLEEYLLTGRIPEHIMGHYAFGPIYHGSH